MSQFELEGIEIRIQQKPLAEFVTQSLDVNVDYTVNPKIYLGEDDKLYFYDDTLVEPISLKKTEQFYSRIKLVDGELRFYEQDLNTYINLSFFSNVKKQFIDKPNSIIKNSKKIIEHTIYDSREVLLDILKKESKERDITVDVNTMLPDILDIFLNGRHSESNLPIYKYVLSVFTYGLSNQLENNSNIFNLDTGSLLNKEVILNEKNFSELNGKLYAHLVNTSAKILQGYDGIGKLIYSLIGPKTKNELNNSPSISLSATQMNSTAYNNTFEVDAIENASCAEDLDVCVPINTFFPGRIAFKYYSGETVSLSASGLLNTPITIANNGCSEDEPTIIGVIDTSLGELSFNTVTSYVVPNFMPINAWFRDFNTIDNMGSNVFEYVFTPDSNTLLFTIKLDAILNADWDSTDSDISVNLVYNRRKMIGVFNKGTITFKPLLGYVRPNIDFSTVFNTKTSFTEIHSGDDVIFHYGYPKCTLGDIDFEAEITFDITEDMTYVELWYVDFDNTDNEGEFTFSINYQALVEETIDSTNITDTSLAYAGPISSENEHLYNYALDHFNRLVSSIYHTLWYDALFDEFGAAGYILFNRFIYTGFDISVYLKDIILRTKNRIGLGLTDENPLVPVTRQAIADRDDFDNDGDRSEPLEQAGTPFYQVIYEFITNNFYGPKTYYEKPELTTLTSGIVDFRNYFIYSGGSGINNIVNRDLTTINDIWIDVPDIYSVIPKITNDYAISTLVNFTADYMPGIPCTLEFRLYDSTADVELDKLSYSFDRYSHTKQIGDILFENKETLHIQLAYFGPVATILCQTNTLKQACSDESKNINSHVLLDSTQVFSDDDADKQSFKTITDRIEEYLNSVGEEVTNSSITQIKAPRVLRVQWKMSFSNSVGNKDQIKYDIGQFTFNSYAPENDATITTNIYAFGQLYKNGFTVQGITKFDGKQKRISVSEEKMAGIKDTKYSISLSCSKNINVWYDNKTANGFEIVAEKEFQGEVTWFIISQRDSVQKPVKDDNEKYIPSCIIDRKLPHNELSDYDILFKEGYFDSVLKVTEETNPILATNNIDNADTISFIDPNGIRCSQECFDDCPESYICSPECYTASLTQSGCGCCECLTDNNCPEGYICNELNECIEI